MIPRALVCLAGVFLVAASAAQAQTTRDGVEALARGDYPRAAEILKPIAESWPSSDHLAEFFMATLYQNGLGVDADQIRACVLYARATQAIAGPLSHPANELSQALRSSLSAADLQRCELLETVGFNHGFQPVTFTIEQGHWISIDLDVATITYDWSEKQIDLGLAIGGAVFLPIEHTELTFDWLQAVRRHFIETFVWTPRDGGRTWGLIWKVVEIVRDDAIPVIVEQLVTVAGDRPPPLSSAEARELAGLLVNENGRAEWRVARGPDQRTGLIETEAERQEVKKQARAHRPGTR